MEIQDFFVQKIGVCRALHTRGVLLIDGRLYIIVYDSEIEKKSYPFRIFCECLTGWGRRGDCKKMNPLFVPKALQSEGSYIIYVKTDENDSLKKFRLMNFEAMQDLQSGCYYETNLLKYLYEYLARKYLQTL